MSKFKRIDDNLAKEIEKLQKYLTHINGFEISFPKASKIFYREWLKFKPNKEWKKILGIKKSKKPFWF